MVCLAPTSPAPVVVLTPIAAPPRITSLASFPPPPPPTAPRGRANKPPKKPTTNRQRRESRSRDAHAKRQIINALEMPEASPRAVKRTPLTRRESRYIERCVRRMQVAGCVVPRLLDVRWWELARVCGWHPEDAYAWWCRSEPAERLAVMTASRSYGLVDPRERATLLRRVYRDAVAMADGGGI